MSTEAIMEIFITMLMTIGEFRQTFSKHSKPDPRTVIAWIKKGDLFGRKFGGQWYIDPNRSPESTDTPEQPKRSPLPLHTEVDNPLVAKVLANKKKLNS